MRKSLGECKTEKEAIAKERDLLKKYLDIAGTMIIALDSRGRVSFANKKACEVLGCREKEILGKDWFSSFIPERLRKQIKTVFRKIMSGRSRALEHYVNPVLTKDGKERVVSWHNTLLIDEKGKIAGTLSSGEDVTEKILNEKALRNAYLNQKTINNILSFSLKTNSLDSALKHALNEITNLPWLKLESRGCVFLIDEKMGNLVMRVQKNLSSEKEICKTVPLGECMCGSAASAGKIMFSSCLDKRHTRRYKGMKEHGHYCVPIKSSSRVIGLLNLYVKSGHEKRKDEKVFLETVAGTIASVIERFRFIEEIFRRKKELERFNRLAVGRELRMIELKKRIRELETKLGNYGVQNKQF